MRIVCSAFCLFLSLCSVAQVSDVRSNIKKDKSEKSSFSSYREGSSSSSSSSSAPDIGDGLAEFIVGNLLYYTAFGVYRGLEYGQSFMQYRRDKHPETFSLEGAMMAGVDFSKNAVMLSPSIRGNWGLFASDICFRSLNDVSGELNALDWQVLKLRIPLKNVKMEYGMGFSHVFNPSKTYFDQSAGFDWCLLRRRLNLRGQYLWSQKTNLGSRYRQESSIWSGYQVARTGRLRFVPTLGFVFQNYFESNRFRIWQLGLRVQLF